VACQLSIDERGELRVDDDFLRQAVRRSGVEDFVSWIKPFCEAGGRVVIRSNECDGWAGGFTFDGKGRVKELQLKPVGRWPSCSAFVERLAAGVTAAPAAGAGGAAEAGGRRTRSRRGSCRLSRPTAAPCDPRCRWQGCGRLGRSTQP
jgi:hypothetical protein